jgi:rod shape-determining protein MreD
MTASRSAAISLAVATATVLQPTIFARMPLPLGVPQLVVLLVATVALLEGPMRGCVTGFAAGLLSDLLSLHHVGEQALVLTAMGYLVGLVADEVERSVLVPLVAVGVASAGALVVFAGVSQIVGDGSATASSLGREALAAAVYDVLLTPLLLPPLRALLVRLDPERRL